jgi:multisubunit Na+/H+ antiporter MnhC subunit
VRQNTIGYLTRQIVLKSARKKALNNVISGQYVILVITALIIGVSIKAVIMSMAKTFSHIYNISFTASYSIQDSLITFFA